MARELPERFLSADGAKKIRSRQNFYRIPAQQPRASTVAAIRVRAPRPGLPVLSVFPHPP